jgi:hypothetical protein
MVAHPPCTHLAVSGARWFRGKNAQRELFLSRTRQEDALEFFMQLLAAPIERVAVENPVSIVSTHIRPPDQIIQPWQYGHAETKATCLWLKNLAPLQADAHRDRDDRQTARARRTSAVRSVAAAQPHLCRCCRRNGAAVGWRAGVGTTMRVAIYLGRNPIECRVLVDGVDISSYCKGVHVGAHIEGGPTRVTLDLVPLSTEIIGEAADVVRGLEVHAETVTAADKVAAYYPVGWPRCACGLPVMDGHTTCGRAECG